MPIQHRDEHDLGLQHDLEVLLQRRRALTLLSSAGAAGLLAACGDGPAFGQRQNDITATASDGTTCVAHPPETIGPFPADGSNRANGTVANVLNQTGIVRRDMRANLGAAPGIAVGVPIEITLTLVNATRACAPLAGYAVYLWHNDAQGRYSIYDLPNASYLRAVAVSDANGNLAFTSVFPGCYPGRYPHMHFEIYASLDKTASYRNCLLASQLALPADACRTTYASVPDYAASVAHFARTSLARDGIFADNTPKQIAAQTLTLSGDPQSGFRGRILIGLAL